MDITTVHKHAREPQIRPEQIYLISGDSALINLTHTAIQQQPLVGEQHPLVGEDG